jgi:hypothetical protein
MKKSTTTVIFFFIGITTFLFGQSYHPFPKDGTWIYQRLDDFWQPYPEWEVFSLLGDTSIAGHQYNKLILNGGYNGALRDSAQRIYFYPAEDTVEHVLYDFNLTIGDTIIAPYPLEGLGYSCDTIVMRWEDTFITSDGFRRRINMWGCSVAEWIEGIGNTFWLTSPTYLGSLSGGYRLTCFYDSTELVYSLFNGNCHYYVGIDEVSPLLQFSVYPNPTSNLLTFANLLHISSSATITDLFGRRVLFFESTPASIDLSALPDGLYFLTVQTKSAMRTIQFEKLGNP